MNIMEVKKDSLSKWIAVTHRQSNIYFNKHLKSFGLNSSEFAYLMALSNEDRSFSQEELSRIMFIDKAAVTRGIRSLEEKGYVTRCRDEHNHRIKRVSLTKKGNEIVPKVSQVLDDWDNDVMKCLGEDVYQSVTSNLYKLAIDSIEK